MAVAVAVAVVRVLEPGQFSNRLQGHGGVEVRGAMQAPIPPLARFESWFCVGDWLGPLWTHCRGPRWDGIGGETSVVTDTPGGPRTSDLQLSPFNYLFFSLSPGVVDSSNRFGQ